MTHAWPIPCAGDPAGSAAALRIRRERKGELNSIEGADNRCRLNFVIENKSDVALESMKLDLVAFGTDGSILRRLLTEMGPVRSTKTMVRTFAVDADCKQIGSILVNDVTACTSGEPGACLDGLALSSRLQALRLYK
jgi:hypothetical protein